ncbi:MAG: DUF3782 domain-containing protein [Candidatus Competibacter sp.]|nr:DUF3782 domain-containing protein [Candidatus Competibacter sp.]MDG4585485.1 DUF3782 domain-containing protein [Candidatus Competibacter sp.]
MTAATSDEVWTLLRELLETQKETDRKFQETDRKFQETDRKFQETDRLLREQSQAADRRMKQLDEQLGKLGNRLGEFVEGLVRPALVRLFRTWGIAAREVHADVSVEEPDGGMQIDLLVVNGAEVVLVEVKSKLTQADVNEHLDRLGKFKRLLPRYADARVLGAVAAMVIPREVGRYAYRQGLFVLAQSGDSVVILNDAQFQPRTW